MIKTIVRALLFSVGLAYATLTSAIESGSVPDTFHIKTNTHCPGGCFKVTAHDQPLGELSLVPKKGGTYVYVDAADQPQLYVRFTAASPWTGIAFDILDLNQTIIARLVLTENSKTRQLQHLHLYAKDSKRPLLVGWSNMFGTKHTFYAKNSWHVLAELSRPLFTWSRDAEVSIIDQSGLQELDNINPHMLPAILALYCTSSSITVDPQEPATSPAALKDLQNKLQNISKEQGFSNNKPRVSEAQLKATIVMMNEKYQHIYDDAALSEEEKIKQFVTFSCELIQSHTLQPEEENAILQFLLERLKQASSS